MSLATGARKCGTVGDQPGPRRVGSRFRRQTAAVCHRYSDRHRGQDQSVLRAVPGVASLEPDCTAAAGGHYQEQKPVESAILIPPIRVGGDRGRGAPKGEKGVARWPASATSAFDSDRIDLAGTYPSGAAPQPCFGVVAPDRRGKFRVATGRPEFSCGSRLILCANNIRLRVQRRISAMSPPLMKGMVFEIRCFDERRRW